MYLAFNHNDTLIAFADTEIDAFKQGQEYYSMTGNAYHIEDDANLKPHCPKCNSILSQADYHLSAEDHYGACLECDEDFYLTEIRKWSYSK